MFCIVLSILNGRGALRHERSRLRALIRIKVPNRKFRGSGVSGEFCMSNWNMHGSTYSHYAAGVLCFPTCVFGKDAKHIFRYSEKGKKMTAAVLQFQNFIRCDEALWRARQTSFSSTSSSSFPSTGRMLMRLADARSGGFRRERT